jgi:hypothetical protein
MNKKILRKFGFKNDQQGIINRYIRESGGWDTHLQNTKDFILQSAKSKKKKSCVVLGSGWLLDVPIDELLQLFDKIILIDIVHPKQILHKYRKHHNIEFVEADITGLIEAVYHFLKQSDKKLNEIEAVYIGEWYNMLQETDFVVSVNILNQLDILICDYIKKTNIYSTEEIKEFRKKIQQNHFDMLPVGKSCLISDYMELNLDGGKIIKKKPLVYINLPMNKKTKKWQWDFDTHQTYHKNVDIVFKVMGVDV